MKQGNGSAKQGFSDKQCLTTCKTTCVLDLPSSVHAHVSPTSFSSCPRKDTRRAHLYTSSSTYYLGTTLWEGRIKRFYRYEHVYYIPYKYTTGGYMILVLRQRFLLLHTSLTRDILMDIIVKESYTYSSVKEHSIYRCRLGVCGTNAVIGGML